MVTSAECLAICGLVFTVGLLIGLTVGRISAARLRETLVAYESKDSRSAEMLMETDQMLAAERRRSDGYLRVITIAQAERDDWRDFYSSSARAAARAQELMMGENEHLRRAFVQATGKQPRAYQPMAAIHQAFLDENAPRIARAEQEKSPAEKSDASASDQC